MSLIANCQFFKLKLKEFLILAVEQPAGLKQKVPGLHAAKSFSKNVRKTF